MASLNRRSFLYLGAAASVVTRASYAASVPEPLRLGVIGPGSRGQENLRKFLQVPGVTVEGVCDIYPPRFDEVNRLARKEVWHTKDARALVERKDIDAVVIASPVALHKEHIFAACAAGKPVFGEKSFGFTVDDCQAVWKELKRTKTLYQVGHEYRYAAWITEAVRRIHAGEIGEPTHVLAYWHRNGNWRRPVPSPNLEHLINWRLYRESSGGLVTELGSHHIDLTNWVFGEHPESVLGSTSIVKYNDGRTVGDNVQTIFNYSRGRKLMFSSITDNAKQGNEVWIYGSKGSVQLTISDAYFFYEQENTNRPAPANKTVLERGVETGASYSARGEMPYRGPGAKVETSSAEDPTLVSCRAFYQAVKENKPVVADAHAGFGSGMACAVAMNAVFTEEKTKIPKALA